LHLGACEVEATVAMLDEGDLLAPGERKRVQLVLRRAIGAWRGDRVVLRDASASRTIAGGVVLDPFAPGRYRRSVQRLAELDALALPDPGQRLAALLQACAQGVNLSRRLRAEGRLPATLGSLPAGTLRAGDATGDWALGAGHARALAEHVLDALRGYHAQNPEELGPDAGRLRRLAAPRLPEPVWRALLADLLAGARVAQRGAFVHLPEHGVKLSATEERIAQKVGPMLGAAGFEGAWVRDLARDSKESEALMRTTLARLAQRGELHQVVKDLFYPQASITKLAAIARELGAKANAEVTAAAFRDATQLGRKRAIQVLEYFDRVGLLRRVNDVHRLRGDTDLFRECA
jgi:selenocysteine-specific elongation factor